MRTRTIYKAMSGAYRTIIFTQTVDAFLHRKARQWAKFERELLRRADRYDLLMTKHYEYDAGFNLGIDADLEAKRGPREDA